MTTQEPDPELKNSRHNMNPGEYSLMGLMVNTAASVLTTVFSIDAYDDDQPQPSPETHTPITKKSIDSGDEVSPVSLLDFMTELVYGSDPVETEQQMVEPRPDVKLIFDAQELAEFDIVTDLETPDKKMIENVKETNNTELNTTTYNLESGKSMLLDTFLISQV